jgi:hypothetical protein
MDSYVEMRSRFSSIFRDFVSHQTKGKKNHRKLKISSMLLIEKAEIVLKEMFNYFNDRLKVANVVPENLLTPKSFRADARIREALANLALATNLFFYGVEVAENKDKEEVKKEIDSLILVLETIKNSLSWLKDISGLLVEQGESDRKGFKRPLNEHRHQYYLFSDKELKATLLAFLKSANPKGINDILNSDYAKEAVKISGLGEKIKKIYREIEKFYRIVAENLIAADEMGKRQKDIPRFDASKPYEVLRNRAAKEDAA